jgi:tetratricopeptide (TPR) repeat protein
MEAGIEDGENERLAVPAGVPAGMPKNMPEGISGATSEDTPGVVPVDEPVPTDAHPAEDAAPLVAAGALVAIATVAPPLATDGQDSAGELNGGAGAMPDFALVVVAPALPARTAKRPRRAPLPVALLSALLLVGAGLALVAAAAGLALALTADDWGSGARAAGIACLALAVLCLGASLVRSVRTRGLAYLGLAATVVWGMAGGGTLTVVNPLRLAQGHALEASHDWPGALRAYLLAGEDGTASDDPARVYIEWGDDLAAQGQYAGAVDRYEQAIVRYPLARAQQGRASARLWPVYATWLSVPSTTLPYAGIIQSLRGYQRSVWCASDCQTTAAALEAQARFAYGLELAGQQQYTQAIKWLESVRAADPTSPFVARAHATVATVYYALGEAQLRGPTCTAALPTFQALASTYKDTPEGRRAIAALAAPVRVSGRLTGYPAYSAPTMYLSTKVYSASHFSDDYSAALDGAGNFAFGQVTPGNYNLSAAFGDGSGRYWQAAQTGNLYAVVAAPLCALNLGTYSW